MPLSDTFDKSMLKDKLPEAFVFVNKHGNPNGSEGIRKLLKKACKKRGYYISTHTTQPVIV